MTVSRAAAADSPATIAVVVWAGLAGGYSTVLLPLMVSSATARFGLLPEQASGVATAEMGGVAIGAFCCGLLVATRDRRVLTVLAAAAVVVANLLSALAAVLPVLLAARAMAGVGEGFLLATMAAAVGDMRNADRVFALFVGTAFGLAALGFALIPGLIAMHGNGALYAVLAGTAALSLVFASYFPRGKGAISDSVQPVERTARPAAGAPALVALAGILAYYLGVGAVWPLMTPIGGRLGVSPDVVARTLALASVVSIAGAALVVVCGAWPGRIVSLVIGLVTLAGALTALALSGSPAAFAIVPIVFLTAWNYSVPYLMGTVALLDPSGRAVAINMTLQYVGFAAGPAIAAWITGAIGLIAVVWWGAACFAACLALFLVALALPQRAKAKRVA
jgi:MFS family permease